MSNAKQRRVDNDFCQFSFRLDPNCHPQQSDETFANSAHTHTHIYTYITNPPVNAREKITMPQGAPWRCHRSRWTGLAGGIRSLTSIFLEFFLLSI